MRFILQMAWRDSTASRRRLVLYSLCIVFGVGALVALDSFAVALGRAIGDESKALLGADIVATSRQPFSPKFEAAAQGVSTATAEEIAYSTMLSAGAGKTRLVQLRGEDPGFPFYGEIVTEPAGAVKTLEAAERTGEKVALVEETLMAQFGLRPGAKVKIGNDEFVVAGALKKISGESLAVTLLAPRVLVARSAIATANLKEGGPLVRYRLAMKLPAARSTDADADAIAQGMREEFGGERERMSIETVAGRRRELGRALTNVDGFLSLVGFIALLLGAIGVASAVHAYVRRKVPTVAVLRCLGTSAGQAFAIYVIQGCALGIIGSVGGAAMGIAVQAILPAIIGNIVPVPVHFTVSPWSIARGMGAGFTISLLFTLLPLLRLRDIPPLAALRAVGSEGDVDVASTGGRVIRWGIYGLIGVFVAGFGVWETDSVRIGVGFAGGLAVGLGVFVAVARVLAGAVRRWSPAGLPFVARQGVANLHRPQNRTTLLLVALGLGTFLFFTLFLVRTAFLRELDLASAGDRPNLMFFDIQDDQIGPLNQLLAARGYPSPEQAAVVTMKITAVRGHSIEELLSAPRDERLPGWTLRREYRSTFRDHLAPTEKVTSGHFIGRVPANTALVPISVDEGLAGDMRLHLGDTIDWDIQGVPIHSQVASIRSVEWRRLEPNFFVVFPAGVLDDAPKFHVVAIRVPTPEASAQLQSEAVRLFPNVSAIDLTLILQTLDGIFSKVSFVIEFMAVFTAATALLVLACAIIAGRDQRRKEALLLRTLGASGRQLARIQAIEYAILGILSAAVGCLLGWGAGALLDHWVFRLPVASPAAAFFAAAAAVVAVTLATGWFSDRSLPHRPPLEALRAEE